MTITIGLGPATLELLAERAAFWQEHGTLFVADLHWGKDASFRARGLPLPDGDLDAELARLGDVLDSRDARRLVILGDLIHDRAGVTPTVIRTVAAWRALRPGVETTLVVGNHDRHLPDLPPAWNVDRVPAPFDLAGLSCVHEPPEDPASPTLAGHLHPTIRLGRRGDALRLPCFHRERNLLTLPAFAMFTNGVPVVRRGAHTAIWAIADDRVVAV